MIVTFGKPEFVDLQLKQLSLQTFKEFDVLIVYGYQDKPIIKNYNLNIIHHIRKQDNGPSGGFNEGEKLLKKYKYNLAFLSEDDIWIVEKDYLRNMIHELKTRKLDMVCPRHIYFVGKKYRHTKGYHDYNLLKVRIYDSVGFSKSEFYYGAEDQEMFLRISNKFKVGFYEDSKIIHQSVPFYLKPSINLDVVLYFTILSDIKHKDYFDMFKQLIHQYLKLCFFISQGDNRKSNIYSFFRRLVRTNKYGKLKFKKYEYLYKNKEKIKEIYGKNKTIKKLNIHKSFIIQFLLNEEDVLITSFFDKLEKEQGLLIIKTKIEQKVLFIFNVLFKWFLLPFNILKDK